MNATKLTWIAIVLAGLSACQPRAGADDSEPVKITPAPPKGADSPDRFPTTTSRLALAATFPKEAIAAQLEAAIPREFHFDTTSDGWRVFGTPSRGAITVEIDAAGERVTASTRVSGRVQVEKRIRVNLLVGEINKVASVGIDVSGTIKTAMSPLISPDWDVNPRLELSTDVERAVAKTFLGDIDITGHVRGPVANALGGARGDAEARLKQVLNLRPRCEQLWGQINGVHKLSDSPPTWLRITPRQAAFGRFRYKGDSIESGLALDLLAQASVQDSPPRVVPVPLPPLHIGADLGDEFVLSLPVEIPHAMVNRQLKAELMKNPFNLPGNASLDVTDAALSSRGNRVLLAIDFRAKGEASQSASGRLYLVSVPVLDAAKDLIRLTELKLTAETRSALEKDADWIAQAEFVDSVDKSAAIELGGALKDAKAKANKELAALRTELAKEFAVNMSVTDLHVDRLSFGKDRTFAVVTAKGKMSAVLRP